MTPAALAVRETAVPVTTPPTARPWAGLLVLLVGTVAVRALRHDAPDVVERAVAWSGSQSGKAWFFGTLDPRAATSVGAPAAGWLPGLSLRVSGTADLGVLASVLTVLAVAVLAATVRRVAGPTAGLVAGAVQALLLRTGGAGTTWSAATVGSPRTAAALELASATAVLTLGTDDSAVSLARFQSYVATGRVRYPLVPGGTTSVVVDRVAASHTGTTVYDLSD